MAEGLSDAASAFQAEISPGSTGPPRPRDEGGRFVAARPETMFEPRPVEGDPLTGDARDAGEDARLAALERRIADGRAEEGDADELRKSVPDDAARARHAADDGGRKPEAGEPERLGPEDEPDQDAERADGEPAAEDAERDAEGKPVEDAGPKYEVTVDGQRMEVSLTEALRGYVREQTFYQRMNKVHEARQAVEQEAATTAQARDHLIQKLQFADRLLAELTPEPPDWDREFTADPRAAHEKQKAYAAIYGKRQAIAEEMNRAAHETAAEYDQKSRRYAVDQFSQFVQEANIQDEKALNTEMSSMRAYGKLRGFSEGELATVYDKRMLLVLREAAKYHQMMAARPKPVIPGKGKTLTPGVATPVGTATRRTIDEAQQRLAKTGRLDDAASVFQRLIR